MPENGDGLLLGTIGPLGLPMVYHVSWKYPSRAQEAFASAASMWVH